MVVSLEEIVFDHTLGSATSDALSVRRNRNMGEPPWRRAVNRGGPPSRAAYALLPTRNNALTIKARFTVAGAAGGQVTIRARIKAGSSSVLGNVTALQLVVPAGASDTGLVSFDLLAPTMWADGIGRHSVTWTWQFRENAGDPWSNFDTSEHTIYTVLDVPPAPWAQGIADTHDDPWPWTEVLDWSCCWAKGIHVSKDAAARRVTERINQLGGQPAHLDDGTTEPIVYEESGTETYVVHSRKVFLCGAFLNLLRSTPGAAACNVGSSLANKNPFVNCTDCATAVVTFANSLGCSLTLRRLRMASAANFRLNMYWLIGQTEPQKKADLPFPDWQFHEVAEASSEIYDATAKLDSDAKPHAFPATFQMTLGKLLSDPAQPSQDYLHRLVAAIDLKGITTEQVALRRIDNEAPGPPTASGIRGDLFRHYSQLLARVPVDGRRPARALTPISIPGYLLRRKEDTPLYLLLTTLTSESVELYWRNTADERTTFRLALATTAKPEDAREVLAWIMTMSEAGLTPEPPGDKAETVGDFSFRLRNDKAIFFVRSTLVARLVGHETRPGELRAIATQVDQFFFPSPTARKQ